MKIFWIDKARNYRVIGLCLTSRKDWMLSFWRWGINSDNWGRTYSVKK